MSSRIRAGAPGGRLAWLDAARGSAAAIVVLGHVLEIQSEAFLDGSYRSVNFGRIGVVAFFMVSGYVISLSLEKQDLRTFGVRRFWRLYPAYWFALAAYLAVVAGEQGLAVGDVLLNLTMLQGLVGGVLLLGVSWTLGIELYFYAQQAAAKYARVLRLSVHAGWFWLAVFVVMSVVTALTGVDTPLALPLMLYTASLGQALYLRDAGHGGPFVPLLLAGVLLEPLGSWLGVPGEPGDWYPSGYALSFLLGLAFFGAFYVGRSAVWPRALVYLGTISYAVYLIHPAVVAGTRRVYGEQDWLLVALQLALVPVVAAVVYRYVEAPTIEIGRRVSRTRMAERRSRAHRSNRVLESGSPKVDL